MLVGINAQKLFVTQDYRNAGISRYIGEITRRLPAVPGDERFLLYTNEYLREWPGVAGERLRLATAPFPTTRPVSRILWEQLVLPLLVARDGLDLLHCPLNVQPVATRCPVVLTIHDLTFIKYPDRFNVLKQRYLATLTRYSARRARRILADSAATRDDVVAAFGVPAERVDVVYPAYGPEFRVYDPASPEDQGTLHAFRQRHGLPEQYVFYLGTLEPRKNVDRLVHAYAQLVQRGLPHALVLAGGKGWHYDAIFRAVEEHGLRDRVVFPGYVTREEQPLWYAAAELFVYPSQYEGFGLPPLEAMACGVPVITSESSSLPEVVGSAGITVDPNDLDALADAMESVLRDASKAESLRDAGPQRAVQFTWEAAAQRCAAAYRLAAGKEVGRLAVA